MRRNKVSAEAQEIARLNEQIKEWSQANLAIVAKCHSETRRADAAENRIAELERQLAAAEGWLETAFHSDTSGGTE